MTRYYKLDSMSTGDRMKKVISILLVLFCICGCNENKKVEKEVKPKVESLINKSGNTLETRIKTPKSYTRVKEKDKFVEFIRNYPLKKDGSPVLLYDKSEKSNQNDHVAVFKLPLENEDLQQCADSVIRMYAEYFYQTKQYDRISFHFVDGFRADYTKWRNGYRIKFNDQGKAYYQKSTSKDTSYQCFKKYLRIVFAYASTLSLKNESKMINLSSLHVGDIFLNAGSPGHVVMVVDICQNKEGKKAFLLAQGYMPAQEFHILKNPRHEDMWYYEDEVTYPFETPEYTFKEGSLRRLKY